MINKFQYCTIQTLAKVLHEHIMDQYDGLMCVTGDRGSGKSAFSRVFVKEFCTVLNKPFDLEKFTYYSKKAFDTDIETNEMNQIFLLDEAIGLLFNRERLNDMQIDLVKKINICRYKGHLIALLIPIFWNLDKGIRDLVRVLIYVEKRPANGKVGYAHIFKKLNSAFVSDPWMLKKNENLGSRFWKSPNYFGTVVIPDYSGEKWFQDMEELALKIKDEKKSQALEETNDLVKKEERKILIPFINYVRINDLFKLGWREPVSDYLGVNVKKLENLYYQESKKDTFPPNLKYSNKQGEGEKLEDSPELTAEVL